MAMAKCPACGKTLPRGHGYESTTTYCSVQCSRDKTPDMVAVEERVGENIRDAIISIMNTTLNVRKTADLLGVSRQQLYSWIKKLDIKNINYWE